MSYDELITKAKEARRNAYAPYSGFKVGAALVAQSGKVYVGCNIENAAYGETVCAERVAFFNAISQGERRFAAIAIVGGKDELVDCTPCGSCRQVMAQFCGKDFTVVLLSGGKAKEYKLGELLPLAFGLKE